MEDFSILWVIVAIIVVMKIRQLIQTKFQGLEFNKDFLNGKNKNNVLILDALGKAVQKKEVDKIFSLFFENKNIDVNKIYNTGETALILAVKTGDATVVKILLDKGAYVNVKDIWGNSPLSLAKKLGHQDIESFLKNTLKKRQRLVNEK